MNFCRLRYCLRYLLLLIFICWCLALIVYSNDLDSIVSELVTFRIDTSDKESHHDHMDSDSDSNSKDILNILNANDKYLVFPEEDLERWEESCKLFETFNESVTVQNDREQARRDFGLSRFAFDVLVSDKIGPRRSLEDKRHKLCLNLTYLPPDRLPKASIVIVYHNEALSVLIRMINSIFDNTPLQLVHEIVLLDDWSDEDVVIQHHLEKYGVRNWPAKKLVFAKTERREGLIRARIVGAKMATGQVLVFLDSHCEVTEKWLEPLLTRILEDPKNVVAPIVDIIHPLQFNYSEGMVCKGAFNWGLDFQWLYLPWSYFDEPQNNTNPMKSPAISGGLFAIDKLYFHKLGDYDTGMDVWGAENIEISLRIWMCGGSLEVLPCSRVGHIFRYVRPYGSPNNTDTSSINAMRTVAVWFDEYSTKFYNARPWLQGRPYGDVTARMDLKRRLNCTNFQWYLDTVYPELKTL